MIDRDAALKAKERYGWVILLGDRDKNPSISGQWGHLETQSREELIELMDRVGDKAAEGRASRVRPQADRGHRRGDVGRQARGRSG